MLGRPFRVLSLLRVSVPLCEIAVAGPHHASETRGNVSRREVDAMGGDGAEVRGGVDPGGDPPEWALAYDAREYPRHAVTGDAVALCPVYGDPAVPTGTVAAEGGAA